MNLIVSIIAILAFIVAIVTLLHAMWGKPKLLVRFTVTDTDGGRSLQCVLINWPVQPTMLNKLGVRRATIVELIAQFWIEDGQTGEHIENGGLIPIRTASGETSIKVSLPPSIFAKHFLLVRTGVTGESYIVSGSGSGDGMEYIDGKTLPTGEYYANVHLIADGMFLNYRRRFFVGITQNDLYWESSN